MPKSNGSRLSHRSPSEAPQTVVVTGASAGVGRAVAIEFAREGARIGLIARDADALDGVRRDVEAAGGSALVLPLDVADAGAVFEAADRVERAFGPIDVWVNNAMVTVVGRAVDTPPEDFRRVTEVTYLGYVHGTLAALRHMTTHDRGVIVQVGSALAYRGIPLQAAYCAAKHAIRGFTDSIRTELVHDGSQVKLTAVHLPAINTPQFDWARTREPKAPRPVAPVYRPEVAARAIVAAAHRPRREYWLGTTTPLTILGNMVLPGFMDRYLARNALEGQHADSDVAPGRPDNLDSPVAGRHRVAGSFGAEARDSAWSYPGVYARIGAVLLAGTLGAALAVAAVAATGTRNGH
jgi:NAD(P)-dependent dehydrogenase (short-subunit alcohol dehydrogenase family)